MRGSILKMWFITISFQWWRGLSSPVQYAIMTVFLPHYYDSYFSFVKIKTETRKSFKIWEMLAAENI